MTTTLTPTAIELLRRAAVRAALAPSVHNTQPWRFILNGGPRLPRRATGLDQR
jgi:nitroreductase